MRRTHRFALPALALLLTLPVALPAAAGELAGVEMPDAATVGGEKLVLNGMGLRKKLFIKVYVAGLYLPAKQSDGKKVLAADTPRRTEMHFLYGVDRQKICDAWDEALEGNVSRPSAELVSQFETLCSWMQDMEKGQRMTYTYEPGEGTAVEVAGKARGTIPGKAFADALWSAWIGARPATTDLREGLLGG